MRFGSSRPPGPTREISAPGPCTDTVRTKSPSLLIVASAVPSVIEGGTAWIVNDPRSRGADRHASALATKRAVRPRRTPQLRSEEHTSELQSQFQLVCRLLLEQ